MEGFVSDTPTLFVSYCHADKEHLKELEVHLKPLERTNRLKYWADTNLRGGDYWSAEIDRAIEAANVAVLLVSPHFLASDFIMGKELPALLQAHESRGLRVLWVCLSHCNYKVQQELDQLQGMHDPKQPLASLSQVERDRVWVDLCQRVLTLSELALVEKPQPETASVNGMEVVLGDITKIEAEAIVIPASEDMDGRFGLERFVHAAGGPELRRECLRIGGCEVGSVRWTRGYELPAKAIIHTVGPYWDGGRPGVHEQLASCYRRALEMARYHDYKSLSFATISTGEKGFPPEVASRIALQEISSYLREVPGTKIKIVCYDKELEQAYKEALYTLSLRQPATRTSSGSEGEIQARVPRDKARGSTK
jgi:O-acetyl-ADP-ribose deacetylase (regulator of RNase III)